MFHSFLTSLLAAAAVGLSAPSTLVNDFSGVFSDFQRDSLESVLVAFDDSTSNQICVVTLDDLEGLDVAQAALRLGNSWGVGSSRNNGILILLKPRGADGYVDVTIQVGRGLEGAVTDAYSARIIRNLMGPLLREDRYFPAVARACDELMALASGEISEPRDGGEDSAGEILTVILILFFLVIFLLVFLKKIHRGGGHGPGGSSGGPDITIFPGSFGGGHSGGSFGGGFGGFGGGSFGGGGASGRF